MLRKTLMSTLFIANRFEYLVTVIELIVFLILNTYIFDRTTIFD